MSEKQPSDPIAQIPYLLKQAVHVMQRGTDAVLRDLELNTAKYVVLRLLQEWPGLSSAQLARRAFLSPQTMNSMIMNLERLGLVTREQHPENARIALTRLTETGERAVIEGRKVVDSYASGMVRHLSPDEQAQFVTFLRRAIEGMGDVELIDGVPHRNGVVARVS
jgi:DNA-binding MarR family transcriptional regulator